jgi:cytochrome oxidase Cu insertion factor (SCO1/SenC/PrrC family)
MSVIRTFLCLLLLSLNSLSYAQALGGDFSLTDQTGQRFELQQVRGKVVLLFFGFTHCMSVCPDSLAKIKAAIQQSPQPENIQAVFISVDPERDTAERLKTYLAPFGENFIGLTGNQTELQNVFDAYQIRVKLMKKTADDQDYMVDHSADIYVLDRNGKIASLIPYGMPVEHIQQVLQTQLAATDKTKSIETTQKSPDLVAWQVTDLRGLKQDLTQFQGKPLVINFWASWCPPCRQELPSLNQAWQTLKDENIQMLAVNIGDSPAAAQAFLKDYPIEFKVWLDESASSFKAWPIRGLPTTLLIRADGSVSDKIVGEQDWMQPEFMAKMHALQAQP